MSVSLARATEGLVEYIRASREVRHALLISDPRPVDNVRTVWLAAGQAANIGIFLILFGAFLYIGRAILLPIFAAAVVAMTLAPLTKAGKRYGISSWISAFVIVALCLVAVGLVATMVAGPVSEWIKRAPEIGATINDKLALLDRPLASLHELQTALSGGDEPRAAGGRLRHPRRRRTAVVLRHAAVLPGRPDRAAQLFGLAVRQPRHQAALPQNHARHRA